MMNEAELTAEVFKALAGAGIAEAQYNYARCLDLGEGVAQDCAEAVRWYLKSAAQGYAKAQYNLALCWLYGEGTPSQDEAEAVVLFQKAAEQGHAMAQHNLGVSLEEGRGCIQDFSQAVRWYRRASDQGLGGSTFNLALCHAQGLGVKRDLKEAARLHLKASEQGHPRAKAAFLRLKSLGVNVAGTGVELTIPNPNESAKKELCGLCQRLLKKNLWCSGCKLVAYCGADCQLKAWQQHKKQCKKK